MDEQPPSRRNKINLFNLDWSPLAHLMRLAGVRRLEFALTKHRAELAVLEYEEIDEDQAPMYPGIHGVFVLLPAPDFKAPDPEEADPEEPRS